MSKEDGVREEGLGLLNSSESRVLSRALSDGHEMKRSEREEISNT